MKPLTLSLLLFLLLNRASGQFLTLSELQKKQQSRSDTTYLMISSSLGTLFSLHPGQVFNTQFTYTSTSATSGASSTHAFNGTSGSFLSTAVFGDMLSAAFVSHHHRLDLGFGLNSDMSENVNGYLRFGYGYIFHFGRFQLSPTLDLYWAFDGPVTMGTIDNQDSIINILGFTAMSQFTVPGDNNGTPAQVYNVSTLEVDYKRNSFLAAPKVRLGTIIGKRIYVGIEAGWFLQVEQSATIKLTQYAEDDDANTNPVGKVHLNDNGSLAGPEVALDIGVCFGGPFDKKKKH